MSRGVKSSLPKCNIVLRSCSSGLLPCSIPLLQSFLIMRFPHELEAFSVLKLYSKWFNPNPFCVWAHLSKSPLFFPDLANKIVALSSVLHFFQLVLLHCGAFNNGCGCCCPEGSVVWCVQSVAFFSCILKVK